MPNIHIDWRKDHMTTFDPNHSRDNENNNIKLVVQDYDGADETTDGEMPDLDTFDVDLDDLGKMETYESNIWDENGEYGASMYNPTTQEDMYKNIKTKPISAEWSHSQTQSPLIYKKSATFPRQKCENEQTVNKQQAKLYYQGIITIHYIDN